MRSWLRALIDGLANIASFGETERRTPMSDAEAIASDWRAVGDDLRAAIDAEKTRAVIRQGEIDIARDIDELKVKLPHWDSEFDRLRIG